MLTLAQLESRRQQASEVPCGDCRACCSHDRIFLGPKDDPRAFQWHLENGYAVLDRKVNGECVYLTPAGCGIHGKAPDICRRMDCRVLYLLTPAEVRQRRISENPHMTLVYQAGAYRRHTLSVLPANLHEVTAQSR